MERFKAFLKEHVPHVEEALRRILDQRLEDIRDPYNRLVYEEIKRFVLSPGKRIRPTLVLLGYYGIKNDVPDQLRTVAASFELLHAYLLIHDDIVDRDEVRRNEPTVWKALASKMNYNFHGGASLAIFAGDITRELIRDMAAGLEPPLRCKVLDYISWIDEMTNRGQVLDFVLANKPLSEVKKEEILDVYYYKTALYTMNGPLGLGAILAGENKNFYRGYAIPLGIAFQITDDILGSFGDPKKTGKPADSDIKEGKRTLLVYYAWHMGTEEDRKVLERVLGREDASPEEVEAVRDVIRSTGALDRVRDDVLAYIRDALSALERLKINEEAKEMLRELAHYIATRER